MACQPHCQLNARRERHHISSQARRVEEPKLTFSQLPKSIMEGHQRARKPFRYIPASPLKQLRPLVALETEAASAPQ